MRSRRISTYLGEPAANHIMNTTPQVGLPPDLFAAAFPFHLVIDQALTLRQIGTGLAHTCPTLQAGESVERCLRILHPDVSLEFEAIHARRAALYILELVPNQVRLRGQMIYLPADGLLVFLGSPWLTDPSDLDRLGLSLNDFALHDPVVDLLQLVQSQTLALADTRRLADRLAAQGSELRAANAALKAEIAERQAVEAELRRREHRFHTLLESASEAIVIARADGSIVLANQRAEQLFGYTREELIGRPVEILMPAHMRGRHTAHRESYVQAPHTRSMGGGLHLLGTHKDGRSIPLEISLSSIETREGVLVMSFITDVTERRRVAEELQAQRDFALQIMRTMGQGLAVTDADGCYEYVNEAFARMLGRPLDALIGRDPREFAYDEDMSVFEQLHQTITSGHPANAEVRLLDAQGVIRHALFTCVPRQRDGVHRGAITVVTDLAERKQLEQALEWARDRALEASRLKSDFLANMSHEIRTPLNSILGMAEMLRTTPLSEVQHEFAGIIYESSNALLALVNDILDFSKIEAGKLVLEQQPFPLARAVESALDVVAASAAGKNIELAYIVDPETPPMVVGDENRLRQILLNLVGNAIKFTDSGEVTLHVDAHPRVIAASTGVVHFAVRDTGIGIAPALQERLFQTFTQVDASNRRKFGGTGLGLAISRRLCEAMGGQMWVESAGVPGRGATFHFTIQVATGEPAGAWHTVDTALLRDRRVFLLLGNGGSAVQWESIARQAEREGMQVRFGSSLAELMAWHDANAPVDCVMIDQVDLARLPRSALETTLAQVPGAFWVVLAPLGHQHLLDHSLRGGYLPRPVKSGQLFAMLLRACGVPPPVPAAHEERAHNGRVRHVLVVEDNPVNQIVARRILERLGCTVECASSGIEALGRVRERHYDLVLMDMQMPQMDGAETTQRLRALEAATGSPPVTIVALTANALSEDRATCLAAGMNDYLSKPIQIGELRRLLDRMAAGEGAP